MNMTATIDHERVDCIRIDFFLSMFYLTLKFNQNTISNKKLFTLVSNLLWLRNRNLLITYSCNKHTKKHASS